MNTQSSQNNLPLSAHFARAEFACNCGCGFDTVDAELLYVLEAIRDHFGKPVIIDSAARCKKHNQAGGGKPESEHLNAKAADIRVIGVAPGRVATWIEKAFPGCYGIGRYDTFTHIDVRSTPARWDRRTGGAS